MDPDEMVTHAEFLRAQADATGVCSPIHRCFPPQPPVCALCGREDRSICPLKDSDD